MTIVGARHNNHLTGVTVAARFLTKRSAHINPDPRANLIVCGLRIGDKRMKQLFAIVLSTAAICAFASATPAAAQDTQDQTPSVQQSDRTQAYSASSVDPANDGCHVIDGSRAESGHPAQTVVCPSIP
jgi:hypothetical protein